MIQVSVLLADDHKLVAEGLRSLIEPEFTVVGAVEDGRALVAAAMERQPDIIVADISMPLLNGIEAVRQLKEAGCTARVVFLTMHPDVVYAARAFEAGASGYVLKHAAPSELLTAIREALQGRTYVTPMIAQALTEHYAEGQGAGQDPVRRLTPRQVEVLQLLVEGRSAKEAADILHISSRTVEFHKYKMMEELGLGTSAELIRFAIKHGIVST
ncbi:response regulator transcription factor [bacterium]|nr:response regulator transcription factor [bacterium]